MTVRWRYAAYGAAGLACIISAAYTAMIAATRVIGLVEPDEVEADYSLLG
jgi:hypothetical protein